ncbi:MAG: 30S ribosomal protein S15 [Parcubacteria group bacterium SW_4_49_11]|jgi:small subunit ribosomal protein S15|nr:MAG: 30S ribosomal protein S15 [Parcubacteria group bacterium SW_4_49_11]
MPADIDKSAVIETYNLHEEDTGSTPVQIAIMTERVKNLTRHLQQNKKDGHSRRGLINIISQRKKLLAYLKRTDRAKYDEVVKALNLRA